MSGVHFAAATGFGRAGSDYERGRPGYPDAAVTTMGRELGIGPGRTVLDLAAGTGKLTRSLTRFGARLVAVEPVAGMREQLVGSVPDVEALDGTAERIPLSDGEADTVVVAQAFHWFDAVRACAEIHRVLRPDGGLGVIWNSWDESVPWVADVQAIVHEHAGGVPRQASSDWQRKLAATGLFTPPVEGEFPNVMRGDLEVLLARVASTSYIAALDPAELEAVCRRVRAVVAAMRPALRNEEFEMPYLTRLLCCRRR